MSEKQQQIVSEILRDFCERQEARRPIELNWRLNMNFVLGNQFAEISPRGDIEDSNKQYFWQEREVFNHVTPIIETRLSKLARVKARATVRPATSDDDDTAAASLATKLIAAVSKDNEFSAKMSEANMWSEVTGSVFYKVVWDSERGCALDKGGKVRTGDVSVTVCPPFEIFPENQAIADLEKQPSVMHVKVLSEDDVKKLWGVEVEGKPINVFSFDNADSGGGFGYSASLPKIVSEIKNNGVLVIEKYEKPSAAHKNGRLVIVAGDKLVFDGELPFINGENGTRSYPFAKQICLESPGAFFGSSVVERIIPVQRAYNTVKNRKHEFMNRIAIGVLAVEDGSVDADNLEEEGLSPGKVLIYRQGSTPPMLLSAGQVPTEFSREEEKLLNEFTMISGVSEVTTYSQVPSNVGSGTAISLLLEQDDTRISLTADNLREAVKRIGKQIIRLYRQYASAVRLKRVTGENGDVEIISFSAGDLGSEDIVFDTLSDIEDTLSSRRSMVYDLLKLGLFTDENGKMSARTKAKLFEILGFGNWEEARDEDEAHIKKARKENVELESKNVKPDIYDKHELHITEHTKLCVSSRCVKNSEFRDRVAAHIKAHKDLQNLDSGVGALEKRFAEMNGLDKETQNADGANGTDVLKQASGDAE